MLTHIEALEAESIFIFREIVAQFERPVLLYSVGKDSSVLLRLAQKAFAPGDIPFPLLHVDTGFKFEEMYSFRDAVVKEIGAHLLVHRNEEAIREGMNPFTYGTQACCAKLKTRALLDALQAGNYDVAIGGARRDEESSRAKERVFSFRDSAQRWNPKQQRPELWSLYNGKLNPGESIRAFPISNWTELDVWHYIQAENIPVVPLYFAKKRKMVPRGDLLIPFTEGMKLGEGEQPEEILSRFRTLGCSHCTGAVRSQATTIDEIILELVDASYSERISRVIDHDAQGSMELKKREGYF